MAAGPMAWAEDVTDQQFRAVGALEVLGAAGLILPPLLGTGAFLVPLAAVGLALTMVGAIATHIRLGETDRLVVPVVVLILSLLLAAGRFAGLS